MQIEIKKSQIPHLSRVMSRKASSILKELPDDCDWIVLEARSNLKGVLVLDVVYMTDKQKVDYENLVTKLGRLSLCRFLTPEVLREMANEPHAD